MQIIGVTGQSGTGKSTFSEILANELECPRIDIDKIGHASLKDTDIKVKLCENFGEIILDESGEINRKALGKIVFGNEEKMEILNKITWGFMENKLNKVLSEEHKSVVLEWILLPKTDFWDKCNTKILVTSDDNIRKEKIIKRDNISAEYLEQRDQSSLDYKPFQFDHIISHNYMEGELKSKASDIYKIIKFDD